MTHANDDFGDRRGTPLDWKVLEEAERWFRAKLRGGPLHEADYDLFSALAERDCARGDFYLPIERPERTYADPFADMSPTTLPPPNSGVHRDLIQMSKATTPPPKR